MEEKESFNEFNNESNPSGEQNVVEIKNDYDNYSSRINADEEETNYSTILSKIDSNKKKNNAFLLRLLASFLAVCAAVAIIQTSFDIPVFSKIFHPTSNSDSSTPIAPVYTINALDSTYKDVTYTVNVDNVSDFTKDEYSLLLVKSGCDTNEYLSTIPLTVKISAKTVLNSALSTGSMVKCATASGAKSLSASTDYVFLILKNEQIVLKKAIKTKDFKHVYSVTLDKKGDYVQFNEMINPAFANYSSVYIEIFNWSTNAFITYASSSAGNPQYVSKTEFAGVSTVNVKVYLLPTDLTGFEDFESKTVVSDTYYLVYEQKNIDIKTYL